MPGMKSEIETKHGIDLSYPQLIIIYEGSNAEVVQLITHTNFGSFLTPDMASNNDARHGIG